MDIYGLKMIFSKLQTEIFNKKMDFETKSQLKDGI